MNRKKPRRNCKQCGREVNQVEALYCSGECQHLFQHADYIRRWKAGEVTGDVSGMTISRHIRRYLIERDGEQCSLCGWARRHPITGKVPLEVDHVNGVHTDHSEPNLRLVCPNCHSLTPTFRALNRGNGRELRRRKLQKLITPT